MALEPIRYIYRKFILKQSAASVCKYSNCLLNQLIYINDLNEPIHWN